MYNRLSAYKQVDVKTRVASAAPQELVIMLLEGALTAIAEAKGHMADRRILERGNAISKAASILGGLSENLNMETGGPAALHLWEVYRHLIWRLHLSHLRNDPAMLDEVGEELIVLKRAWLSVK